MKRNSFIQVREVRMADQPARRPRIEGARQREIFTATMELIGEVGFDRLTVDAVAARAKVSKATIYRLWGDKSALLNAAIEAQETRDITLPDTGSLRGDLMELAAMRGFFDTERATTISGLATAIHRDPARLDAVRERLFGDGTKHVRALMTRAVDRGELVDGVDIELLSSVIPAMVLFEMTYRTFGAFDSDFVSDVTEKILVPVLTQNSTTTEREDHGSSSRR
jgi:AcrR family transcriptional regulator